MRQEHGRLLFFGCLMLHIFLVFFIVVISFPPCFAKGSVVGVILEGSGSSLDNCEILRHGKPVRCKESKSLYVEDIINNTPSVNMLEVKLGPHVDLSRISPTQAQVIYVPSGDEVNLLGRTKTFLKSFLEPVKLNDFYGSSRGRDTSSEEEKNKCRGILQEEPYLQEPYATVLSRSPQPLTFVWEYDFSAFVLQDSSGKDIFREKIKDRTSIQLSPERMGLKVGQRYTWSYEYEGRLKEKHPLQVLDLRTEQEILETLNQIDSQSVSSIEKTFQKATYLQLLSDTKEGVELYWLSNAFLPKNITGLSEKDGVMVCKLKLRYLKYLENF